MDGVHLGAQGGQRIPMSTIQGGGEKIYSRARNCAGGATRPRGPELTELYNRIAKRTIRKSSPNGCAER
jgi:hypothetical protein